MRIEVSVVAQVDPTAPVPLFSVIIPFEYHRGKWEQCLRAWQAQTLPGSQFELILVVPPGFPGASRSMLPALVRPQDRIEYTEETHDIALCAVGGKLARGQFLFFTEAHCWPEPDVLEKCLKTFAKEPDLTGFSCCSLRIVQNRLSNAEADMYDADIEFAMTVHPWRKVLDQCFVTHRDRYDEAGGFKAEYGHFSEWVLAASYFELGHKLGYEPDARFYHYYIGDLADLREFTRSFSDGEIRYFAQGLSEPGSRLLDPPPEWICHGQWNRSLALSVVRIAVRGAFDLRSFDNWAERSRLAAIGAKWVTPAVFGAKSSRALAAWRVLLGYLKLRCAIVMGSKGRLDAAFTTYVSSLIHHQRITSIMALAGGRQRDAVLENETAGWNPFAPENAGFYPIETFKGHKFRWSESAAIMDGWLPVGQYQICIDCVPVRPLNGPLDLRIYFNQQPVPDRDVWIGPHRIKVGIDVVSPGRSTLAWTCRPFPAIDDPRLLGLPIRRIDCNAGQDTSTSASTG